MSTYSEGSFNFRNSTPVIGGDVDSGHEGYYINHVSAEVSFTRIINLPEGLWADFEQDEDDGSWYLYVYSDLRGEDDPVASMNVEEKKSCDWRVATVDLDEEFRGQGIGLWMYERVIKVLGRRCALSHDSIVSPDAKRVWGKLFSLYPKKLTEPTNEFRWEPDIYGVFCR